MGKPTCQRAMQPGARGGDQARQRTPKVGGVQGPASASASRPRASGTSPVRRHSGGNPHFSKEVGEGSLRADIAAMSGGGPGWRREIRRRLGEMITCPLRDPSGVRKAVRSISPCYGLAGPEGERVGWSLSMHCMTRSIKVAIDAGTSLMSMPPIGSMTKGVRTVHMTEPTNQSTMRKGAALFDEELLASGVRQAVKLPGSDCC